MKIDALISIRFLTSEEGGRKSSIQADKYGCPIMVDDRGFDCQFVLTHSMCFELGESYKIPVKLLNLDRALEHLKEETKISVWEGKIIGVGEVVKIL